ncbi:hypothetical protein AB0E88_24690 [Streptomyces sp. NPDC028635]|uniref:hypothetical protein n=1 Tax=Streptomyces sp. NPDC028635 TaxID=3154800 RepID=UPI0033FA525A
MTRTPTETTDRQPHDAARGRHRRPRHRRVLLAAGGLALAAGVLSLVRLAPESGVPGLGTAEAGPRTDHEPGRRTVAERSADAAATVSAAPRPGPSAADVMGGKSTGPVATVPAPAAAGRGPSAVVTPSASVPLSRPPATAATGSGRTSAPPAAPPASTAAPAPPPRAPAPSPSHSSTPPTPPPAGQPGDPGQGLCLPIIAVCLGPGLLG